MPKQNSPSIDWNEPVLQNLPTLRLGWRDFVLLLAGYVALDWASYIHPLHGLNITPWSPAPALGLVFLLRFGRNAAPPLALAILAADAWVRSLPVSPAFSVALAVVLTLAYWAIAEVLRRRLARGGIFSDRRGLLEWASLVIAGTFLNSLLFVSLLSLGKSDTRRRMAGSLYPLLGRRWRRDIGLDADPVDADRRGRAGTAQGHDRGEGSRWLTWRQR